MHHSLKEFKKVVLSFGFILKFYRLSRSQKRLNHSLNYKIKLSPKSINRKYKKSNGWTFMMVKVGLNARNNLPNNLIERNNTQPPSASMALKTVSYTMKEPCITCRQNSKNYYSWMEETVWSNTAKI
jgi:hypothetical protein